MLTPNPPLFFSARSNDDDVLLQRHRYRYESVQNSIKETR